MSQSWIHRAWENRNAQNSPIFRPRIRGRWSSSDAENHAPTYKSHIEWMNYDIYITHSPTSFMMTVILVNNHDLWYLSDYLADHKSSWLMTHDDSAAQGRRRERKREVLSATESTGASSHGTPVHPQGWFIFRHLRSSGIQIPSSKDN